MFYGSKGTLWDFFCKSGVPGSLHTGIQQHLCPKCLHSPGAIPQLQPQEQGLASRSWDSPTPTAPAQTAAGPDPSPGDDSSSTLHSSAGTALDEQLGTCSTSPSPQLTQGSGIHRESTKKPKPNIVLRFPLPCQAHEGWSSSRGWSRGTAEALCSCQGTRRRFLIYSKPFNSSAIEQNHRQLARSPLVSRA